MDGFNGSNEVVDVVSGNNLSIGHASGTGFTTSTPVEDLHISENATDGASVGFVVPSDPDDPQDIVSDGSFTFSGDTAHTIYSSGQFIGGAGGAWEVTNGDVGVEAGWTGRSPLGGLPIDMNGNVAGTISQDLTTEAGRQYQVVFSLTGNWNGSPDLKELRVSAAGESNDFQITEPSNWSSSNLLWEQRSFTFTAEDATTALSFESLVSGVGAGAVIGDVQVVEIPQAVNTILNNDPTLSYDAATDKFYRVESSGISNFQTAIDSATSATLNGISGQLVTIRSNYENELIRDMARNVSEDLWIGATDRTTEGDWFWLDGNANGDQFFDEGVGTVGGNYQNWIGDNPTSANDAARMRQDIGEWETTSDTATYGYIVEWDASEVLSSFTFSLNDDAGGRFAIDSSTGEITVADGSLLDYETSTSHSVTVEVTDAAGNTFAQAMIISLDDGGPTQTIPIDQTINEDETLVFSTGNGTAITVGDGTADDSRMQVTLTVNNGTLRIPSPTGLTFVQGFNNSSSITIEGTEANINASLEGLIYTPTADYNGLDSLVVTTAFNADLEGYYTFEGGNADDQSASTAQNGTFVGDATTLIDGTRGEVLSLDGTGDHVQIANTFGSPTSVTIGGWVNFTGAGRQEFISIDNRVHIALDDSGNGVKGSIQTGASSWNDLVSSVSLSGTGWNHVMYTFDDSSNVHNLYINGELVATESITDSIYWTGATTTYIGAHPASGWNLNGLVDDARIYNRALSANEIEAIAADEFSITDTINVTINAINDAPYFTDKTNADVEQISLTDAKAVTSTDLDNDGDVDLIATTDTGQLYWYENDGTGSFGTGNLIASGDNFRAVEVYDLEGDGDMDIVAVNDDFTDAANSVFVLTNQFIGSGAVTFSTTTFEGSGVGESDGGQDLAIGDIDGDGRADIVGTFYRSIGDSQVVVFEQDSVGVWTKTYSDAVNNATSVDLADLDGDGNLDLVVSDFQDKEIRWYENDGNATAGFSRQTIFSDSDLFPIDLNVGDFDGDGDQDIVYATWGSNDSVNLLRNDGAASPSFTTESLYTATSGLLYHINVADMNGDGDLDLLITNKNTSGSVADILVLDNDGTGNFAQRQIDDNASNVEWAEGADLDGDGNLDIISAPTSSNVIEIYKGQGDGFVVAQVNEDVNFGGLHLEVADDAGSNLIEVTINVVNGEIILPTGSVNVLSGGSGTSAIAFEGTVANVNAALNSFTFSPDADFFGLGEIQVTVDDRGNTGTGGTYTVSETLYVDVLPQPDALTDAHYTTWIGESEFVVNSTTSNNQDSQSITPLLDGGFLIVWESNGQDGDQEGIYFQRYDAAGNAVGSETAVNTTTIDGQTDPEVSALTNGGFVIVWESEAQDTDGRGVYARTFDADGTATSGEVLVNTHVAGNQDTAMPVFLSGGGFVVVWESNGQDGSGNGVYFQRFDDNGVAQGSETQVNTTTSGNQSIPRVTATGDGGFIAVWHDDSSGHEEVKAQRFDAVGASVGGELSVNTYTTGSQDDADVAALTGGNLVIVWESVDQDGSENGIYAQLIDSSGNPVGSEFQVNSTSINSQQDHRVNSLPDGGFMVIWESNGGQDGDDLGVFAQQFDANGNKVNGEFQVNATTSSRQATPEIAVLNDGRMVGVWEADNQDGSGTAVVARIFNTALNENAPIGTVAAVASQIVDPDAGDIYSFSLVDDAGGAFAINSADGTITVLDPSLIDFENASSMSVTVRITDPVSGTHDEVVTINLNNLAEAEHTVPGAQSVAEDGVLTFSSGNGNAVTVTDTLSTTDAPMQVTISVNDGVLNLSGLAGITIVDGADGSNNVTFNGSESDINAALEGMTYTPDANFNGAVSLSMTTALAADLQGHYTFAGGNADDQAAGTSYDGLFNGDATTIVDPDRGEVLSLDGDDDFVQITGLLGEPANVTLSSWINATSVDTFGAVAISMGTSPALYLNASGNLEAFYESGGSNNIYTGNENLVGTGWRHVALTIDDATREMSIYLDGELVGTLTGNGPIEYDNHPDTYIGRAGDGLGGFDFTGQIDDARIYSRALSADEIAALATDSAETTGVVAINVDAVNDQPQFNNLNGNPTFTENSAAVVLDADVEIFDVELSGIDNFGGASLVLQRDGGANAEDVFSATGNLDFNGASLELSSTAIGNVTQAGGNLILTFNSGTTNAQVNEVMQSIAYSNSNDAPPDSVQINWSFQDGNTGAHGTGGNLSATGSTTVNVVDVPNPADIVVPIAQSVDEDTPLTFSTGGGNAITIDGGSTYDPIVTTTLSVTNGTLTLGSTTGITFLDGTSDGDATLTISGTESAINTALDGLQYQGNQDYNGSDALSVTTGSDAAVEANLHARYEFLNGSPEDETSNNLDGTVVGNPTLTTDPERGDVMTFDGDDKLTVANATTGLGGEITIAAWVNLDAGQGDNVVLSLADQFYIELDNNSFGWGVGAFAFGSGTYTAGAGEIDVAGTGWRHVAATFSDAGDELRVYIDGNLERTLIGLTQVPNWGGYATQDIAIGDLVGTSATSGAMVGSLDDVRIYNSALTETEIVSVMGDNGFDAENINLTINPVNDAPVESTIEGSALGYTEGDGAVAITSTISITDADDTNIESAVIEITGNYVNGEDILAFVDTANITGSWDASTGTLTLTGTDTLANYESALRSVTYNNGSDDPTTATRTVSFTVNDGDNDSNALTRDIGMTAVNDAPVESTIEGTALGYTEGDGPVAITSTISITDVDDTNIESAVIQITGNYVNGEDILAVCRHG